MLEDDQPRGLTATEFTERGKELLCLKGGGEDIKI
jgi:hypothetical protein